MAGHISTSGGAELGCIVAHKVIESCCGIYHANVHVGHEFFREGMKEMMERHGDIFPGPSKAWSSVLNSNIGRAVSVSGLYEHGVWAIFSSLDKRVLQWKPGALLSAGLCQEILDRFDAAMPRARELLRSADKVN